MRDILKSLTAATGIVKSKPPSFWTSKTKNGISLCMVNKSEDFVAWAMWIEELDEAHEHLQKLIKMMVERADYGEADFRIDLGHVYAHLNRAWHSRNQSAEITEKQWTDFSKFPADLDPVG